MSQIEIVFPRGVENESIVCITNAGDMLIKAMEVPEKWNDDTYERFKSDVVEPVKCALNGYLTAAKDMYENLESAVVLGEHIFKICEQEVFDASSPWHKIVWARGKMFPKDGIDELLNEFTTEYRN